MSRTFPFLLLIIPFLVFATRTLNFGQIIRKTQALPETHTIRLPKLIPFRQGDLWGFADSTGTVKIQTRYTYVKPFENGIAQVYLATGTGLINLKGNEILKPVNKELVFFPAGIRVDTPEKQYELLDLQGNPIFSKAYDYVRFLETGNSNQTLIIAGVKTPVGNLQTGRNKLTVGLFNMSGQMILPVKYSAIDYKRAGIIEACIADTCQYISADGKMFLSPGKQRLSKFKDGIATICEGNKCGYIDITGKIFIAKRFASASHFSEGLAAVTNAEGKSGYINKKGELIAPAIYEDTDNFKSGLAIVRLNGKYGFIGKGGRPLTTLDYDKIKISNYPGKYYLIKDNKSLLGSLDTIAGKFLIEDNPQLDVGIFSESLASVSRDNLYGYINEQIKLVIPYQFTSVSLFKNGLAVVAKPHNGGMRYGIIDKENRTILPFEFGKVEIVSPALFKVQPIYDYQIPESWGLANRRGVFTAVKYKTIGEFINGMAPFQTKDSFGMIDLNGKEVLPAVTIPNSYEFCDEMRNGIMRICHKESKKEAYMDRYGNLYAAD